MSLPCYAMSPHLAVVRKKVSAGVDYSDIIFYHDADSLNAGGTNEANKAGGDATVTFDANLLLDTSNKVVGTGCWDQNNYSYAGIKFDTSGNIDFTDGRLGFYFRPIEDASGNIVRTKDGSDFRVYYYDTNEIAVVWGNGNSAERMNFTRTLSVWYFLEFKFDGNNLSFYLDGNFVETETQTSPTLDDPTVEFFSHDSPAWDSNIDQVIISNDKDRDLYAVRAVTDFS